MSSQPSPSMLNHQPARRKLVVIGAGPVGCLAALSMAKMGWKVELYEGRPDMRLPSSKATLAQRSINLAISARGLAAIHAVDPGMADRFLETVIPMKGRMLHDTQGRTISQQYDGYGQCINSIDRGLLNEGILDEVMKNSQIEVFFDHKLTSVDFDARTMHLTIPNGGFKEVTFDLCIGADGSYSVVRRQLMRVVRMDYQQEYIPHEYVELKMPAGVSPDGSPKFLLDPNHLHIWPRHTFMLIALPNKNMTFTCTLFAPTSELERLQTQEQTLAWFQEHFPDAVELIGKEALLHDFSRNPRSSLICIKTKPYHYKDCAIILGDAAHSMVPFYGQGLNCGLEDVRVLQTLFRAHGVSAEHGADDSKGSVAQALAEYSTTRHEDLVAICDLAMNNYVEMRHSVTTPSYILRKYVDSMFAPSTPGPFTTVVSQESSTLPFLSGAIRGWLPLYTMVTFRPDISYSAAKKKAEWQSRVAETIGWLGVGLVSAGILGSMIRKTHFTL